MNTKTKEFERLWGLYIAKLQRVDELKALGRYGYQLRMPLKSVQIAHDNLDVFCRANGIETP